MDNMYRWSMRALAALLLLVLVGGLVSVDVRAGVTPQTEAASAGAVSVARDSVAAHIEVREWRVSQDAYQRILAAYNDDLAKMAEREKENTRVMYVFDCVVRADEKATMLSGSKVPYISEQRTKQGTNVSTVRYEDVGCRVSLRWEWYGPPVHKRVWAALGIDVSDYSTDALSSVQEQQRQPVFTNAEYQCETAADLGEQRNFVMLSTPHAGDVDDQEVLVYLFQVRFDPVTRSAEPPDSADE